MLARRELPSDIDEPLEQPVNAIVREVRQTMPIASKCKRHLDSAIYPLSERPCYLEAFSQIMSKG